MPDLVAKWWQIFAFLGFAKNIQVWWPAVRSWFLEQALRQRFWQRIWEGYRQGYHACRCRKVCDECIFLYTSHFLLVFYSMIGIGEIVLLPLDVLKIKRQTNPEAFRGRGLLKIVTDEGLGLYRGAGWTAARNAPGSFAVWFNYQKEILLIMILHSSLGVRLSQRNISIVWKITIRLLGGRILLLLSPVPVLRSLFQPLLMWSKPAYRTATLTTPNLAFGLLAVWWRMKESPVSLRDWLPSFLWLGRS